MKKLSVMQLAVLRDMALRGYVMRKSTGWHMVCWLFLPTQGYETKVFWGTWHSLYEKGYIEVADRKASRRWPWDTYTLTDAGREAVEDAG